MASSILYPPRLNSKLPTFIVDDGKGICIIPIELSKYQGDAVKAFKTTVHIRVTKQSTGVNCINTKSNGEGLTDGWYEQSSYSAFNSAENSKKEYRNGASGIIVDATLYYDTNLGYYTFLTESDIAGNSWVIGWVYKIQVRFCNTDNPFWSESKQTSVSAWLNTNSSKFSEWSTIGIVKATGTPQISVPGINLIYPYENFGGGTRTDYHNIDNFSLSGKYKNKDTQEFLKSFRVRIYNINSIPLNEEGIKEYSIDYLVDDSKVITDIYSSQYKENTEWMNDFNYYSKYEPVSGEQYCIRYTFTTINDLEFDVVKENIQIYNTDSREKIKLHLMDLGQEETNLDEEEGRISLKIYQVPSVPYTGNVLIRRTSEDSNFLVWEDLKVFPLIDAKIEDLEVFRDYTAESGKYYAYGLVSVDSGGFKGALNKMGIPVMRDYEYSYLLGPDDRQLKLIFNYNMDSYKINKYETKVDTIGSKYPVITRNAAVEYRTFPINGLISFQMDENNLFYTKDEAFNIYYNSSDDGDIDWRINIGDIYENHLNEEDNPQSEGGTIHNFNAREYDYIWERKFREKVLEWLHNGSVKLFKSPTEGNILVRLIDISCTPNVSLGRMIYSFTATAHEVAECNYDNLVKYNFIKVGQPATKFVKYKTKIGQLYGSLVTHRESTSPGSEKTVITEGDNVFELIYDKYDSNGKEMAGYTMTIQKIYGMKISMISPPMRIKRVDNSNSDMVLGHKFYLKYDQTDTDIVMYHPHDEYEFDENVIFTLPKENNVITDKMVFYSEEPLGENSKFIDPLRDELTIIEADQAIWDELNRIPKTTDSDYKETYYYLCITPRRELTYPEWCLWKEKHAEYVRLMEKYDTYYGLIYQKEDIEKKIDQIKYGINETVDASIDFLYKVEISPYQPKQIKTRIDYTRIGQIFQRMAIRSGSYSQIYDQSDKMISGIRAELLGRYYLYLDLDGKLTDQEYSKLVNIRSISIEANPGAVFGIIDELDNIYEEHDINDTGYLELYELQHFYNILFLGYRNPDGTIRKTMTTLKGKEEPAWCDVIINYIVDIARGTYA